MINFSARTARHWMTINAAKKIRKEIEQAGLDNLKDLAERGVSIVGTFLQGCSPKKREEYRQNFNGLLAVGITPEMVLDEIAGQIPEIGSIMKRKDSYKQKELDTIRRFLKGA